MKIKSKIFSIIICVIVIFSAVPANLSAASFEKSYQKVYCSETNTEVIIKTAALGTPQNIINEIAYENPNSLITISNYVEAKPKITPRIVLGIYITSQETTASNFVEKDAFVISVAKGSEKTLTTTWKQSVSASASQSFAKIALGLNATLTKEYTKTEKFYGPPEDTIYNSREFRVKFYVDKGTYKGYYLTDMGKGPNVSGNFVNPLSYAEYSIDKKIS